MAVEDAVALQGSSTTFVIRTLMRAREAALGGKTACGVNGGTKGGDGGCGLGSPLGGPRAAVRLIKAIGMIEEGAKRVKGC